MDGMTEEGTTEPAGLSERPQEAGGDRSAGGPPPQRFSAKMKLRAVSRLQRGEPLELVARELNVTAARLSKWRDRARRSCCERRSLAWRPAPLWHAGGRGDEPGGLALRWSGLLRPGARRPLLEALQ